MSQLSAFLHPVTVQQEKEFVLSKRFVNEDGSLAKVRIRSLTQAENEKLRKLCTKTIKGTEHFDADEYGHRLIVAATIEPDFSSEEMCKAVGAADPAMIPAHIFTAGEYARLSREIMKLCGFDETPEGEAAIEEAVKN